MPVPFGPRKRVHSCAALSGANEARPATISVVASVFISRPMDGFESRFLHGNVFEPASEIGQRLFHAEAFETRCADKTDGVGVLVDVGGLLGCGNRSAMGEEDDVLADLPCTFDDAADPFDCFWHRDGRAFHADGAADRGTDMRDDSG